MAGDMAGGGGREPLIRHPWGAGHPEDNQQTAEPGWMSGEWLADTLTAITGTRMNEQGVVGWHASLNDPPLREWRGGRQLFMTRLEGRI